MNIPSYFNSARLTLQTATRGESDGGNVQSMTASDPEGDTVTLSKWTEDTGAATVTPDTTFTVSYSPANGKPEKAHSIGEEEAYDLYSGLEDAPKSDGGKVDFIARGIILGELRRRAGVGGAV